MNVSSPDNDSHDELHGVPRKAEEEPTFPRHQGLEAFPGERN